MNKAFLTLAVLCGFGLVTNAQLGKPTTKVKDTLYINQVYYNGTELNRVDWPDSIIVEDALNVYIANYVYVKGKLKSSIGERNFYDATCNGKTTSIIIERGWKYTIGDYVFKVSNEEQSGTISDINPHANFSGKGNNNGAVAGKPYISPKKMTFALAGRSVVSLPAPTYSGNAQGTVVIKIWVDRQGNVTRAEFESKGSNTIDAILVKYAKEAARNAKFNADENAPETQTGSLTYIFKI